MPMESEADVCSLNSSTMSLMEQESDAHCFSKRIKMGSMVVSKLQAEPPPSSRQDLTDCTMV